VNLALGVAIASLLNGVAARATWQPVRDIDHAPPASQDHIVR